MDTLNRDLEDLVDEVVPPLVELSHWERLVIDDDPRSFEGECTVHDGCQPVMRRR